MVWAVYLVLIALALPLVLVWHLNAAVIAGIMVAAIVGVHLLVDQRICLDCGERWRPR